MSRQVLEPATGTPVTEGALSRGPAGPVERVPTQDLLWPRMRRVTGIQDNLNRQLTLLDLSAVVHMSPYHFARLFKQSTGVPPHRFLVEQRIARASALLREPQLSIGEVGRLVGFRIPSHFTAAFRRMTGITPSAYRGGWRHGR
jgi:AraC-like DNA-binding protein